MRSQNPTDIAEDTKEQVNGLVDDASEVVKNIASRGKAAAQEAGETAQGVARQAARQAGAAAETVYNQSLEARDVIEQAVVQNPLLSLFVAGAVGYGLACLVKMNRE